MKDMIHNLPVVGIGDSVMELAVKDLYKTFPNGTYFFVDNNIANDYIKKWSVK